MMTLVAVTIGLAAIAGAVGLAKDALKEDFDQTPAERGL